MFTVGWAHRSGEVDSTAGLQPTTDLGADEIGSLTGVERVDLRAAATEFRASSTTTPDTDRTITGERGLAPTPPPPPSVAVTTTAAPQVTTPRPTVAPTPAPPATAGPTAPPATAPPAPTTAAPPTTSFSPPTSLPPTSLPTGGS